MADGTAIDLFDENDDKGVREKAHKKSRERQDEVGLWQYIASALLKSPTQQPRANYGFSSWASDLIDHENQVTEVV